MANRFATFEIFVSQAVQKLVNDASWGRTTKDLRKQCTEVLGALSQKHGLNFCFLAQLHTANTEPTPRETGLSLKNIVPAHCAAMGVCIQCSRLCASLVLGNANKV